MNAEHPVSIRPGTAEDLASLIRLGDHTATAPQWSHSQYLRLFNESTAPRLVLVAECELPELRGKQGMSVVGFLVGRDVSGEFELENIVVAEKFRRNGIGTQLMQAFLTQVKQMCGESVFLEVRESNKVARALYEGLGFQQTGQRKSYYTAPLEDAVLYSKVLQAGRNSA